MSHDFTGFGDKEPRVPGYQPPKLDLADPVHQAMGAFFVGLPVLAGLFIVGLFVYCLIFGPVG